MGSNIKKIEKELFNGLPNFGEHKPLEIENELMTRKQCKDFFQVSYVTLYNWKKKGILMPLVIGGKVFYKKESIIELISSKNQKD